MDKIIISPAKYIQGNGSLDNIATYAASLGTEPLIIADEFVTGLVGDRVSQSFARENIIADFDVFAVNARKMKFLEFVNLISVNIMSLLVLAAVKRWIRQKP